MFFHPIRTYPQIDGDGPNSQMWTTRFCAVLLARGGWSVCVEYAHTAKAGRQAGHNSKPHTRPIPAQRNGPSVIMECPYRIQSVKALTKFPNANEASKLLQRLVHATQALLIRKKWKVPLLTEFLPKNPGLLGLNVNRGAKIMIRLRNHESNTSFLPWEALLGTLVHELVHIEISSHSYEFYRMVDELCDEVQNDLLRGPAPVTSSNGGPAFWPESGAHRLGGAPLSDRVSLRDLASNAANKRLKAGSGEYRLGGNLLEMSSLSKKELMARAAERRLRDNTACGDSITVEEDEELIQNSQEVDILGDDDFCRPCVPITSIASSKEVISLLESPEPPPTKPPGSKRSSEVIDLT